ncbi:MAG: tetracycline resistance MFS efflux pump [Dehalococcoidia bacterium]|nr:MAG: tetracycline resistance MFS efflux pump [Dehalococcoidia bacterium]
MTTPPRRSLPVLFLVVLVSVAGTALVTPLLPFYAVAFGVDGVLLGLPLAAYPLMQFVFSPLWGRLSDRIGRRPVILISLAGTGVGFLLLGLADSFWLLLFARLVGGAFGANVATAQAYVADLVGPNGRTRALGILGAAFGLGFILGPASAAVLVQFALSAPAFFGAALSLANLVAAARLLPESRPRPASASRPRDSLLAPLRQRPVALAILVFGVSSLGSALYQAVFPLYARATVGFGPSETGVIFALVGGVAVFSQGVLVGRLSRRFTEHALLRGGLLLLALAAAHVPIATALAGGLGVVLGMLLLTVAESITAPAATAFLALGARSTEQGTVLGLGQSVGALTRVIGPLAGAQLLASLGPFSLFLGCAVLFALSFLVALATPRPHPPADHPAFADREVPAVS